MSIDGVLPTQEDAKQWKAGNAGTFISPELTDYVAKLMSDYAMEVLARSGYFDDSLRLRLKAAEFAMFRAADFASQYDDGDNAASKVLMQIAQYVQDFKEAK